MPIENRNLLAGTRLVANYKKQRYVCNVVVGEKGEGVDFVLEDGTRHKSLSAAGSRVMAGQAVNGWRFWSLEGAAPETQIAAAPTAANPPRTTTKKAKKLIFKTPNQSGVAQGKTKWFCSACLKSFVADGDTEPQVCPEGHRIDDPLNFGGVGTPEKEPEAPQPVAEGDYVIDSDGRPISQDEAPAAVEEEEQTDADRA